MLYVCARCGYACTFSIVINSLIAITEYRIICDKPTGNQWTHHYFGSVRPSVSPSPLPFFSVSLCPHPSVSLSPSVRPSVQQLASHTYARTHVRTRVCVAYWYVTAYARY